MTSKIHFFLNSRLFLCLFTIQTSFGLSIWQQISKEFFSKLYPSDPETTTMATSKSSSKPTATMHTKKTGNEDVDEESMSSEQDSSSTSSSDDSSTETTTKHYRHITFSRGLSKYGPWGYLILGMLLCGGALLVCVLWGKYFNFDYVMSYAILFHNQTLKHFTTKQKMKYFSI